MPKIRNLLYAACLANYVDFYSGDAIQFLESLRQMDFLFLDDDHHYDHVMTELDSIHMKVAAVGSPGSAIWQRERRPAALSALGSAEPA